MSETVTELPSSSVGNVKKYNELENRIKIYRRFRREITSLRWEIEKYEDLVKSGIESARPTYEKRLGVSRQMLENMDKKNHGNTYMMLRALSSYAANPVPKEDFYEEMIQIMISELQELESIF